MAEPAISHHSPYTDASLDGPGKETEIFLSKAFRRQLDEIANQWITKDQVMISKPCVCLLKIQEASLFSYFSGLEFIL